MQGIALMWLFTTDGFLSIVAKGCKRDQLMVRARARPDIKRAFPKAKITQTPPPADYAYRAIVSRKEIAAYLVEMVATIDYSNFKDTVRNGGRHQAYLRVWNAMFAYQEDNSRAPQYRGKPKMVAEPPSRRLKAEGYWDGIGANPVDEQSPARGLFADVYDDAGIWHPDSQPKRRTKR
jgi:hypothetical protein